MTEKEICGHCTYFKEEIDAQSFWICDLLDLVVHYANKTCPMYKVEQ